MNADFQPLQTALAAQKDVKLAIVFGSMATGRATRHSDLDLAIGTGSAIPSERRQELADILADLTGRPIDLIDLATVGGSLLGRILRTGTVILRSDPGMLGRLHERFLDWQADLAPAVGAMLESRRKRSFAISHG
jgi:predicted nucleotidyltransferase